MTGKNKDRWESHEAKDFDDAIKRAIAGDVGSAVVYLCSHQEEAKDFCERLKKEAPSKSLKIFKDILVLLMNDSGEGDKPFSVEGVAPTNLKAAKEAAVKSDTAAVAAFLKAHPDQIELFCNALLGSFSGIRMAIALAMRGGERDYFDVMAELLTFLLDRNGENVQKVRSRIEVLFRSTELAETDEGWAEDCTQNGHFYLGGHPVRTRVQFLPGHDDNGPRAAHFLEDLFFEGEGADEEELRRLARPFLEASIEIHFVPAVAEGVVKIPGYFQISKEALNEAMSKGELTCKRRKDSNLEFDIVASAKARATTPKLRIVK